MAKKFVNNREEAHIREVLARWRLGYDQADK